MVEHGLLNVAIFSFFSKLVKICNFWLERPSFKVTIAFILFIYCTRFFAVLSTIRIYCIGKVGAKQTYIHVILNWCAEINLDIWDRGSISTTKIDIKVSQIQATNTPFEAATRFHQDGSRLDYVKETMTHLYTKFDAKKKKPAILSSEKGVSAGIESPVFKQSPVAHTLVPDPERLCHS